MIFIYGKRKHVLKEFTDQQIVCGSCGNQFGNVRVCQSYYHLFFIPIVSASAIFIENTCLNCHSTYEAFTSKYSSGVIKPLRFYSVPILISALILALIFGNIMTQKKKAKYVENPKVGDVYLIRDDRETPKKYYFYKIADVNNDLDVIEIIHSAYQYKVFVSKMDHKDYFTRADQILFTKNELKKMLQDGFINSVERNYDKDSRFHVEK
jgi:hypothetical protein